MAVIILVISNCFVLFSQEEKAVNDTVVVKRDSLVTDTLSKPLTISPDAIDMTITHTARGYRKTDFVNKKEYLVGEGVVTYGDITLKADSIMLNMDTGVIFATGRRDSTGKMAGIPVFQQGTESFESEELTYNFKTRKARVLNMVTQQEEGYLHSEVTKKLEDGSFNISKSTYSTCDAIPPHFYVGFNKAKVVPGKKIITGPAYLVLEGIPLPLVIPFGFFPIQKKTAESGIIIPKIGQTFQLGYSLRDGGYYFAINDNFDLGLTGSLYTNGTWMINATSNYVKRYKYSGRISLSYANNITGHKGLQDYSKSWNYRLDWTYAQDPKAHPGSRFSASVSMSSSAYDKNNSYVVSEHVNTTRQSSISYSKSWDGTPFNISVSVNHSQNVSNKTVSLNLPKVNFNMSRIYPLKSRKATGPTKWYQDLQFQYSASIDNQINTFDSLLFTPEVFKNMRNGFKHDAPLSIAIRPFRKITSFTISPSLSYSGVLFTQKFEKRWDPSYFNPVKNIVEPSVITDTLRGFFYGQSVRASVSAGINPQIFGTYTFKQGSRVQAIRHVIKPSIGFNYVPVLNGLSTDMYKTVQVDTSGRTNQYSVFQGNIFQTPSLPTRSGGLTFSLVNTVEAKVFQKNDTTGKARKVKIIDNFTINTSYNIFADSLRWAPVNMSLTTTLFENISVSARGNFSMYGLDSNGRVINTFYYQQTKRPLRMTGFNTSVNFSLNQLLNKWMGKESSQPATPPVQPAANEEAIQGIPTQGVPESTEPVTEDDYGYASFNMPWSLRVAYNFTYSKPLTKSTISQTLSLSGDLTLTRKTRITYTSGYDITKKKITMTSIGIVRDLHCWEMSFGWVPTGYLKSWNFTIRVKASVLADLKYERRKDFHDQY